jgi:hypothetical protein
VTPRTLTIDELERWMLLGGKSRIVELSDEQASSISALVPASASSAAGLGTPR